MTLSEVAGGHLGIDADGESGRPQKSREGAFGVHVGPERHVAGLSVAPPLRPVGGHGAVGVDADVQFRPLGWHVSGGDDEIVRFRVPLDAAVGQ